MALVVVIIVALVIVVAMGVIITAVKSDTPPPFSIGKQRQLIATLPPAPEITFYKPT